MIYIEIFLAFFWPGILGYGGGPASIPLIQYEVVDRYEWMTNTEFSEALAFGNSLPGPIATKMAGYIGYDVAGISGAFVGLFATIAPSLLLMFVLLGFLYKHKDNPKVKRMTAWIRPIIAILLGVLAFEFFWEAGIDSGWLHTAIIAVISYFSLEKWKVHPALVIVGGLAYGLIFLS
ncbi:chromate transporter [Salsuginibacillus kocurii]|uniref:chromate transporter n=1 Tax=Salsuginibacillus kocurii TaxID=427078 RepID=UPI0003655F63|nr:chromate transporter [Salsuginibacillus kocurii]